MKRNIKVKRLHKTELLRRILVVLLCMNILAGVVSSSLIFTVQSQESSKQNVQRVETREEIKARLMKQIRYEGWDPYSSDMTIEEFYALMELFNEGKLPLVSSDAAGNPGLGAPVMDGPGIEEPSSNETVYIPRTMFMFGGLTTEDTDSDGMNNPLDYSHASGAEDEQENYPAGLDPYSNGYLRPPMGWDGVPVNHESQAVVIVPDTNKDDPGIAGDVDQALFLKYENHYVRRVTAQNTDVTVLGAIKLSGSNNYVYYYLTNDSQEHDVSTTTLPEGEKFIIQYAVSEHLVEYELHMDSLDGSTILPDGISLDSVFGADRPTKTEDGKYAFTATAPYGYTLVLYLLKPDDETTGGKPVQALKYLPTDDLGEHLYADVNEGWALGMDPDYVTGTTGGGAVTPNTGNGPSKLTWSGTFYNNQVHYNRTVIGVLKPKGEPRFLFAPLYHRIANVSERGSVAQSWYDTDLDYAVNMSNDPALVKAAEESGHIGDYRNNNRAGGFPNLFTADGWNWNNHDSYKDYVKMMKDPDGTYSYSFTFQTNSSDNYVLDSLAVNGFSVTIPFYPKYPPYNNTDLKQATGIGVSQWMTETVLPDGVKVKVEYLLVFGNAQRHYRITVSGAQSDVVISGMNLMQYRSGAAEFSAYHLNGIIEGDTPSAGVQFYTKNNQWKTALLASINVDEATNDGLNTNGFGDMYGANFRFKLADGYDSPYFLWESTQSGMIADQGSGFRDDITGEVTTINPVKPLSELSAGDTMDSNTIYGPDEDGYYYFRVYTQSPYKIALLTVVARPVRYVVRYVPSYKAAGADAPTDSTVGIIENPGNMPQFTHSEDSCHESFRDPDNGIPDEQYDDKEGQYYDTAVDTVIILPGNVPTDPDNGYIFVDWVLVDNNFDPIKDENGNELHYRGSNITLAAINQYAIANEGLGGEDTDIYVLRLMPTWRVIENPFNYKVALNWVDSTGELHEDFFDDFWKDVLTDWDIQNGYLTVKVLTEAVPFQDWIAQHPTYTFWNAVNNNNALYRNSTNGIVDDAGRAAMRREMANAMEEYLPALKPGSDQYEKVLDALCNRDISGPGVDDNSGDDEDDFWRLGGYAFQVFQDNGTIVVWMYEDKGGVVFRKAVQDEPLIFDDEFYFTVSQVMTASGTPLNGTYKAYPDKVYDENGRVRARLDKDAWLVTFANGNITSIVKNDGSNTSIPCFTLKNGDEIGLYVPAGEYTITELGSKSGGAYQVEVTYDGKNAAPSLSSGWILPDENGNLLLKGYEKTVCTHMGDHASHTDVSQVSASVRFEIGEANVVHALQFTNMTASLSVEKKVDAIDKYQKEFQEWLAANPNKMFHFQVTLTVPAGYEPLSDRGGFYFTLNIYNAATGILNRQTKLYVNKEGDGTWTGEIDLYAGQRASVVMAAPDDGKTIYWDDPGLEDEPFAITDSSELDSSDGVTPGHKVGDAYYPLYYYDVNGRRVYIESFDQIQYVTKDDGDPTLRHNSGETLYYEIGSNYIELPTSLSDVNLQAAIVTDTNGDNIYQVCERKDVPLYYFPTEGGMLEPITKGTELVEAVNGRGVFCEIDGNYYSVQLTEIDDDRTESGKNYEGVYQGIGSYRLKINCPVYIRDASNNSSYYSPVLSLNEILIDVKTMDVPVSKGIISYSFKEIWKQEEWADSWNSEQQKTNLFVEQWTKQSGTVEVRVRTEAKIVNWYVRFGYLVITQKDGDPNKSFIYKITDSQGDTLIVTVKGGGETYVYAPIGEYTIEEITDWAWQYEDGVCAQATGDPMRKATVTVTKENDTLEHAVHADYTNERNDKVWLGGEQSKDNRFAAPSAGDAETENVTLHRDAVTPVIFGDEKKKRL